MLLPGTLTHCSKAVHRSKAVLKTPVEWQPMASSGNSATRRLATTPGIALFGLDWLAYGMCTLTNVEIPLLMLNGHRNAKLKGQYGVVLVGLLLGDRLCY